LGHRVLEEVHSELGVLECRLPELIVVFFFFFFFVTLKPRVE